MTINTTLLKEKSIVVNQFIPSQKMQMQMNRINSMPLTPQDNNLQCELQLNLEILDEEKKVLAVLKIAYIVIATLENEESYSQNEYADKIFASLQSMFFLSANELLRETPFPPLPLNIKC